MTYIVVVRGPDGETIHRGKDIYYVLYRVHRRWSTGKFVTWSKEMDACVRAKYRELSARELAAEMSAKFGVRITKNMVIRRWHTLKRREKR